MIVDAIIVVAVVGFAVSGYLHGLISSVASFLGFVVGLIIGIRLAVLFGARIESSSTRIAVVLVVIIALGAAGQFLFSYLAGRLRRRMTWEPARAVDRVLGGLVSAVAAVVVCWLLAVPLAGSPLPAVSSAVKDSALVKVIDDGMPRPLGGLYGALQQLLANQGLPDVVDPLNSTSARSVGPPEPGLAGTAPITAARPSIVKVHGRADSCSRVIDGSGFVFAKDRIMTNAHVLAGTSSVEIETVDGTFAAVPVYIDEDVDIAVLKTSGFDRPPLALADAPVRAGADVVVAGHPGGGDYQAQAARVRGSGRVTGPTFRRDDTVVRDVYALRAEVIPGNSGGPLLAPDGRVLGVVFASAADNPDVGYALTDAEIQAAVQAGATRTQPVATGACS